MILLDLSDRVIVPQLVHAERPQVDGHHVQRFGQVPRGGIWGIGKVVVKEAPHGGFAFQIRRCDPFRGVSIGARCLRRDGQFQLRNSILSSSTYDRCISVFVDTDDRRRLSANINSKSHGGERNHAKKDRQEHGAIGIGAQHAIVLVISRVAGNLRYFLLQVFGSHCSLTIPMNCFVLPTTCPAGQAASRAARLPSVQFAAP